LRPLRGHKLPTVEKTNTSLLASRAMVPQARGMDRTQSYSCLAWREDNLAAGQRALYHRARSNGAACVGKYMDEMEAASKGAYDPPDRQELRDD
jgi:hypothetical protein